MIELVHTSVPHGLLSGDGGFCTVAATKNVPAALRQRLESLSSYKHLVSSPGPEYESGNPVAWSHLVLQSGEHLLSCVRACPFDYTNRTNRIARHWCFAPGEVPEGTNFVDALLGGAAEELSSPWTGEPRWLPPRSDAPLSAAGDRADRRPVAWNALFGEADGPILAAGFAALLIRAVRDGGRGVVFRTTPAADGDGAKALPLFGDLLALLPSELRSRAVFSTYPATLPAWMPRHLVCLQADDPALSSSGIFVNLERGTVVGSERLPQDADLLQLARHGREKAPPPSVRPFSPTPIAIPASARPSATLPARKSAGANNGPMRASIGRTISPQASKKIGLESVIIWILVGAIAIFALILAWVVLKPEPALEEEAQQPTPVHTNAPVAGVTPKQTPAPKPEPTATPVATAATNAMPKTTAPLAAPQGMNGENGKSKPAAPTPPPPDPMLSAKRIEFRQPPIAKEWHGEGFWYFYDKDGTFVKRPIKISAGSGIKGKSFYGDPGQVDKRLTYNADDGTIYWNFVCPQVKNLFATTNRIDLRTFVFGTEPLVFSAWSNVWAKQSKTPWNESYRVTILAQQDSQSFSIDERFLSMETIIHHVLEKRQQGFLKELGSLKRESEKAKQELEKADKALKEFTDNEKALTDIDKKIENLKKQRDTEKNEDKKQNLLNQIKEQEEARAIMPLANDDSTIRSNTRKGFEEVREEKKKRFGEKEKAVVEKEKQWEAWKKDKKAEDLVKSLTFQIEPTEFPLQK